jgi:hypothetical protein
MRAANRAFAGIVFIRAEKIHSRSLGPERELLELISFQQHFKQRGQLGNSLILLFQKSTFTTLDHLVYKLERVYERQSLHRRRIVACAVYSLRRNQAL